MGTLLEAKSLEIAYGDIAACQDIGFTVEQGEIVTLVGANGAGKTTTMRAVAGSMLPRKGTITFEGRDITRLHAHERLALGIALVPEGRHVFPYLSVTENLEIGAYKYRADKRKVKRLIEQMITIFPILRERARQPAGTLSGGEQQMLVLARAMMSEPRLLCLDEPSLGLAPLVVKEIFNTIRTINANGTSVLLVEQNAHYALSTASRGYVLQTGRILTSGPCTELRQDEKVRQAYLGHSNEQRR
jgi:branched-chain amino acid transport system ATP-binding protein